MGSLIRRITAESAAGYGVNILEVTPPGQVQGVSTRTIGVVGHFPWGPTNTVTTITSVKQLYDTFCPEAFAVTDDWASMDAFLNKTFPGPIKIVRIEPSSMAAATLDFDDEDGTESVTVTANYKGSVGNSIQIAWTANADDATARDATVTIGSLYSKTYPNVATKPASSVVVTDPGDPFVTFSKHASSVKVPDAVSATSLATGADGTPAAADYTGSGKGILKFYGESVSVDVLFCAEPGSSIVDDVNTGLKTYATSTDKGMVVLSTPAGQSVSTAITYAASYRDDRVVYVWPRVKTTNVYDTANAEITVDGAAFAAVAIASVDPEISPGGASGAPFLTGITALENEDATKTDLANLNDAGVAPWVMSTALGGAIIHRAVTTLLTSGRTKIFRRRMTDFITNSIAARWEYFVELPLDLNLSSQTLGKNTGALINETKAFLEGLKVKGRIQDYSVDPYSQNLQTDIDAGSWTVQIMVDLFSAMEQITLKNQIGEGVTVVST